MLGDEMPGALERRTVDPPGGEPQRCELRREDAADLAHPVEILGTAVDVDHALEQRERVTGMSIDEIDQVPLLRRTRSGRLDERKSENQRRCERR